VAYLSLAGGNERARFDEECTHKTMWADENEIVREATFSDVIFSR
jgi:hypothetical protein